MRAVGLVPTALLFVRRCRLAVPRNDWEWWRSRRPWRGRRVEIPAGGEGRRATHRVRAMRCLQTTERRRSGSPKRRLPVGSGNQGTRNFNGVSHEAQRRSTPVPSVRGAALRWRRARPQRRMIAFIRRPAERLCRRSRGHRPDRRWVPHHGEAAGTGLRSAPRGTRIGFLAGCRPARSAAGSVSIVRLALVELDRSSR
jgi:hypothetical protein